MTRAAHIAAATVGVGILACITNASILNAGGWSMITAPTPIALACGLAIGAAVLGIAWRGQRRALAVLLGVALVAGEVYQLQMTAERTLTNRDTAQAPLREAAAKRTAANIAVLDAQRALDLIGDTPRLRAAMQAKATADRVAVAKAAENGCRTHCRALLEQQVAAAAIELDAARREMVVALQAAERRLVDARQALGALPALASPSPLADRLGVEPWQLDLLAAALASIAMNGLAAILIAFAAHRARDGGAELMSPIAEPSEAPPRSAPPATIGASATGSRALLPPPAERHSDDAATVPAQRDATNEAARFARTMFRPAPAASVRVRDLRAAYQSWCTTELVIEPLPDAEIVPAFMALFERVGLRCDTSRGDAAIAGIAWAAGATVSLPSTAT